MKSETRRKLIAIIGTAVCMCAVIIAGMLARKYVDVEQYVVYEYSGANGYASVSCSIDKEKLYNDLSYNETSLELLSVYQQFVDSIKVMTAQTDLANGDVLYISVDYDKDVADAAALNVGNTRYETRVSGISDGEQIDLFDGIEVTFAGISPEAIISIENKWEDEFLEGLEFTADKSTGIAVNDTVTVTCNTDEKTLARYGYVAGDYKREYRADKLSSYAANTDKLGEDMLYRLEKETEAAVVRLTADKTFRITYKATGDSKYLKQSNEETASGFEILDVKFLKRNPDVNTGADNYIYYMCSADVTIGTEMVKIYFAMEFSQCYITYDGVFKVNLDSIDKDYRCSWDYETLKNAVLYTEKLGYTVMDVAKYTS